MRTDGTMKVAVFEETTNTASDKETMLATANLLNEASNWIRDRSAREVQTSTKKRGFHRMYNIMTTVTETILEDAGGSVVRLFVHYDDNEKG